MNEGMKCGPTCHVYCEPKDCSVFLPSLMIRGWDLFLKTIKNRALCQLYWGRSYHLEVHRAWEFAKLFTCNTFSPSHHNPGQLACQVLPNLSARWSLWIIESSSIRETITSALGELWWPRLSKLAKNGECYTTQSRHDASYLGGDLQGKKWKMFISSNLKIHVGSGKNYFINSE